MGGDIGTDRVFLLRLAKVLESVLEYEECKTCRDAKLAIQVPGETVLVIVERMRKIAESMEE